MVAISIIVPVYNVHDCLTECLESIRKQSLSDYECILVDDGSTDGSSIILDEFCEMDSRFSVIHQRNSGVGAARNTGLQKACGTYITFIDSDDKIVPTYLEDMWRDIGKQDVLISGFMMCKSTHCKEIGSVNGGPSTDNMACAVKQGLLNSCWGKLFRREIIQGIHFPEEILWGEDTVYLLTCLCRTNQIIFVPSYGYLYTYSTSGLGNRFDKMKPFYLGVYYKQLLIFSDRWAEIGDSLYREITIKISQEILRTIDVLVDRRLSNEEEKEYIRALFENPRVNRLFFHGVLLDDNPVVLKLLSRFPSQMVWRGYVMARRCALKGKK